MPPFGFTNDGLVSVKIIKAANWNRGKESSMTAEIFRKALHEIFDSEGKAGAATVVVNSGNLHRLVGGYPGPNHRMPICCDVMRQEMRDGDRVIAEPPRGNGASLTIEYLLPR
jgi:5-methylcytosine-specific restriction protein A